MDVLSSGLVIVGAYENKVRRTLFGMVEVLGSKELRLPRSSTIFVQLFVEKIKLDRVCSQGSF